MQTTPLPHDSRVIDKLFYTVLPGMFYEPFDEQYIPSTELIDLANASLQQLDSKWIIVRDGIWSFVEPPPSAKRQLPYQGWKIHVSATPQNCKAVLKFVIDATVSAEVSFKFANDIRTLRRLTSKRWVRGGAGKFITVYPRDDTEFKTIIGRLYNVLKEEQGPYVLPDKRYKDCKVLYYRYGGIHSRFKLDIMGRHIPILISPAGDKIEDIRTPYFNPPLWAVDPFPNSDTSDGADLPDMTLNGGRFQIKEALHFSNSGGVYRATDSLTGREVVIKEARPFTEIQRGGVDAVARLQIDADVLVQIGDLSVAPRCVATFKDWENFYLAEEYVDAIDLREIILGNSPLLLVHPDAGASARYYDVFRSIFTSFLEAVDKVHSAGIAIGDVSPRNILVHRDDYAVTLVDFEAAYNVTGKYRNNIRTPGFARPHSGKAYPEPFRDDLYSVATIMLYSIFPIAAIGHDLRTDLYSQILPILLEDIGWQNTAVLEVVRGLIDGTFNANDARRLLVAQRAYAPTGATPVTFKSHSGNQLGEYCNSLAEFILRNTKPEGQANIFGCDPFASRTNHLSLGFGSSGIMYSLTKCGSIVPDELLRRCDRQLAAVDMNDLPPGILTGAAGIALCLFGMGRKGLAERYMQRANESKLVRDNHSLYYGMAGIGLANIIAFRRTGDSNYVNLAVKLANTLVAAATTDGDGMYWKLGDSISIGFGYGQSGVALFFLRLSQLLNDPQWKKLGSMALHYDVLSGSEIEPGIRSFHSAMVGHDTFESYIEQGSAGIAKIAIRYGLWDVVDNILPDVERKYSLFAGVLYGLSGFIDVLVDAYRYSSDGSYLAMAERPLAGLLDFYLIPQRCGYATPGEGLFRISCDYATGVAGVLRSLHRLLHPSFGDFTVDELDGVLNRQEIPDIASTTLASVP